MNETSTTAKPSMLRIYATGLAFPVIMVLAWIFYGILNTAGLPQETATTKVINKQVVKSGANYHTSVIGGQTYVQGQMGEEAYLVEMQLNDERVGSFVSKEMYTQISTGDTLKVRYRKTRFSSRTQMVEIIESSLVKG